MSVNTAQLGILYRVFVRTELNQLIELLEDDGRTDDARRVREITSELNDICNQPER